ncbi:MAG TPA: pseudouridine-5'-phosphate glycosidase [Chloroflexota bacterium]|nr:pseudouridine-5'-phosphate glycosidase [Chloroflexota bacterium]
MTSPLRLSDEVATALPAARPVVALESTLFVHGLPRPVNLEVAAEIERIVREEGAVPATIGVVAGEGVIGLSRDEIERLSTQSDIPKLGVRDLAPALALRRDGATTVASTSVLAHHAGIAVFATGGLGGVHRDAVDTFDESADLTTLARTPITIVSAGVKSILDVAATLERLESLSITILGWQTGRFPGFYLRDAGFPLDWTVEEETQVAAVMAARSRLDLPGAILVANPVEEELDQAQHDRVLAEALAAAQREDVRGKAITPFLLDQFHRATDGASLRVNTEIIYRNARLGARIARAWSER